ncbi:rho GTPase-activating protein 22-like [Lampris incognitus]|uniref:rho GTPase-activating protein 22-like n=1 Tax=Lampris incognitus TaxID=2546036 RepID=UPI0024B4901A|nr:rho GTPase-activating protein 22-like [Lampris incognitus]
MELHCLPAETPTTSSSRSTDPLYDNCPAHAQRGRERHSELQREWGSGMDRDREHRALFSAVTRLPAPRSPLSGLAPAVTDVPTLGRGRGPGTWPDHSYCSWGGGLVKKGWEAELGPGINRAGGGVERGRGREEGIQDTEKERVHENWSPTRSQSEQHESALSVYDNIQHAITSDNLLEAVAMETGFQEPSQQEVCQVLATEQIQGLMKGGGVSGESSSWSSCEIILAESRASNRVEQDWDVDQDHPEWESELDSGPRPFDQELQLPTSYVQPHPVASLPFSSETGLLAQRTSAADQHPGEIHQEGSRMPPPLPTADPSASALRSILTGLQQQIVQQREEYEAHIIRLEQRNEELQGEVMGLRANLAQQRRWYQVVQAKIQESEQARAAAELRNTALQREMEQFFDTFGELNNEAKKTERIVRSF